MPSHSSNNTSHKFLSFPSRHTLIYIPIAYASTIDVTLYWKFFLNFYELFVPNEELEIYALKHYLNLTYFLIYWSSYIKHGFVSLVGPTWIPPSV